MIYYVEDDPNVRDLTLYALHQADLDAKGFACGHDFFAACENELPKLILLDIMLPDEDGLEILRKIRSNAQMQSIPVMMLTAKGTEFDKVCGLDAGADDYLAKPFGMMELISRVKALLRRAGGSATSSTQENEDALVCSNIKLLPHARNVRIDETPLTLTRKEFDVLQLLMENKGCVLSREQLLEKVWDISYAGQTRTVDVHIRSLRRKIAAVSQEAGKLIHTVHGVGYSIKDES